MAKKPPKKPEETAQINLSLPAAPPSPPEESPIDPVAALDATAAGRKTGSRERVLQFFLANIVRVLGAAWQAG